METKNEFRKEFVSIAVPVALQSMLQSSFSVADQIMAGQLGETGIAGIGLAGKFASLYSVVLSAVAAAAGILIAQYIGGKDEKGVGRSFYFNLGISVLIALLFLGLCECFPVELMGLYTTDAATGGTAALYLGIVAWGFVPMAGSLILATLIRCMNFAALPLYAAVFQAGLNTVLNYVLIFGKAGFPKMGVAGAAVATVASQTAGFAVMLALFLRVKTVQGWTLPFSLRMPDGGWRQFGGILVPILACEFFWSLGENVYASIYGHIGTDACAAMTLTGPVQVLFMGAMGGISQAAGILTGKRLGAGDFEAAYRDSRKMMGYGLAGSLVLSAVLALTGGYYVRLYQVSREVRVTAYQLLVVFAVVAPVKVQNMILGGGIIRSGGRTKYVMAIDMAGTWLFGVPLGLLTAFVFGLPVTAVYFFLSLEECVRLLLSWIVFRGRKWMARV